MAPIVINGQLTSYDLPNYVGELFQKRRQENAFLRLIGGLNGNLRLVAAPEFSLGVDYELPAGAQKGALEGAVPTASQIGTSQTTAITQIFQEAVELTYTAQSQQGVIGGLAVIPGLGNGPLQNPNSLDWQIQRKLDIIQNDFNYSALLGTYQKPADNTTARKMRGVASAIVTNAFALDTVGGETYDKAWVDARLREMVGNYMFPMGADIYVMGNGYQLEKLISFYTTPTVSAQVPASREVVGIRVRTIETTFARLHLVYEPIVPAAELHFIQPQYIRPVCLPTVVDGQVKGLLFAEPLAKTGSADKYQLYGEWGVDYTNELFHAKFTALPTA